MTSQPSTLDWDASGDFETPCDTGTGGVRKMRRGELRELAMRERERRLGLAGAVPADPIIQRDNFPTPFQNLAENCGFKVIRDDDNNGNLYDGPFSGKNDSSDGNSIRTNTTCTSLWSGDASPANRSNLPKQDRFQDIKGLVGDFSQSQLAFNTKDGYSGCQAANYRDPQLPFLWKDYYQGKAKEKNNSVQFKISRQHPSDFARGDGEDATKPFRIVTHNPGQGEFATEECKGVKIDRVIPPQTLNPQERSFRAKSCSSNDDDLSPPPRPRLKKYREEMNSSGNCKSEQKVCKDDNRVEKRQANYQDCGGGCVRKRTGKQRRRRQDCSPPARNDLRCASDTEVNQNAEKSQNESPPQKNRKGGMAHRLKNLNLNPYEEKLQEMRLRKSASSNPKQNSTRRTQLSDERGTCHETTQSVGIQKDTKTLPSSSKAAPELSPQQNQPCPQESTAPSASRNPQPCQGVNKAQIRCSESDCEDQSSDSCSPDVQQDHGVSESTQTGDSPPFTLGDAACGDEKRHQDYKQNINCNYETAVDEELTASVFIGQYLFELWKNQCLCDVRLKVGNSSFLAHKLVLAAFSDVFCPKEPQRVATICFDVPCTTPDAVFQILQYLYTSEMELTDGTLEDVHNAASFMGINEIVNLIEEILSKPTMYNFEKYMKIRENLGMPAYLLDFPNLLRDHFIELINSSYFQALKLTDLETVLQDVDIKVESEIDVINAIIKWIEYNPMKRMRYAANLLCLVNFDCMDPESLSEVVERNKHLFDLDAIAVLMEAFKKLAIKCNEPGPEALDNRGKRGEGPCSKDRSAGDLSCFSRDNDDEDECYICDCHRMSSNNCTASCNNSSVTENKKCAEEPVKSMRDIRNSCTSKRQYEQKKIVSTECDRNTSKNEDARRNGKPRAGCPGNNSNAADQTYRVSRRYNSKMSFTDSSPDKQTSKKLKAPPSLWEEEVTESVSPMKSDTDIDQAPPPAPAPCGPRLLSRRDLFRRKDIGRPSKNVVHRSEDVSASDVDVSEPSGSCDRSCTSHGSSRDSSECQRCRRSGSSSPQSRKSSGSDKSSRKRVTWLK